MLLATPILQRIEQRWDRIAEQVIAQRDIDPELSHYRRLSNEEIEERAKDLARNLAFWSDGGDRAALGSRYENLGRQRFHEGIPLHEVIYKIHVIERSIRNFASAQNNGLTAIEIHAELETQRIMNAFFAFVVYHVAKGYEAMLRGNTARTGAAAA